MLLSWKSWFIVDLHLCAPILHSLPPTESPPIILSLSGKDNIGRTVDIIKRDIKLFINTKACIISLLITCNISNMKFVDKPKWNIMYEARQSLPTTEQFFLIYIILWRPSCWPIIDNWEESFMIHVMGPSKNARIQFELSQKCSLYMWEGKKDNFPPVAQPPGRNFKFENISNFFFNFNSSEVTICISSFLEVCFFIKIGVT